MGGPSPEAIEISIQHLKKAELPIEKVRDALPPVSLRIPALLGRDIEEHFWRLGEGIGSDYYRIAEGFAKESEGLRGKFEPGTIDWVLDGPGWTKYDLDGKRIGSVAFPDEPVLVFDVETCKAFESCQFPLLCVAMSLTNIYSWLSPKFLSGHERAERLIRFGQRSSDPQLLIGHNVSFDRARIMEEYQDALNFDLDQIVRNARRFLDTLSLHSAVSGISSQQRITWTKYKKERNQGAEDDQVIEDEDDGRHLEWCKKGSMANLVDVVHLHCDGLPVDKGPRELLLKEDDPEVIRSNLSLIFDYCLNDVAATAKLYHSIWPKFLTKCPHPVTFTAMLEMTGCALPVDGRWQAYVEKCEGMLEDAKVNLEKELVQLADRIVAEGQQDDAWKSDPWLSKLDWTPVPARYTQAKYKKDGSFAKGGEPRPIGLERLFGMPMWYRKLWEPKKQAIELTTKARIVPYLLRMSWSGAPVHFIPSAGWCYRIKLDTHTEQAEGDVITDEEGLKYKRVPHGKEQGANVGCLLSKDYLAAFEKGILETDETAIVKAVLALNSQFSFWTGYRERIKDQLVIYQDDEPGITKNPNQGKIGVILPQTIPMGTVTRRAVESTWMTASNPKPNLVGSELKSLVSPPEGWCLVGADVDSQELWIASLLGDSQFSLPGSTAISWMTLQGTKSDGSDLHSRTARLLGLTRDAAKIFTYGRIYGAGASYAAQLLQKGDPRLAGREAADKARQLYHATKGRRIGVNGSGGSGDGGDSFYVGGTESFMFNSLERIARSPVSRTPALSAAISDALLSTTVKEDFLTSRINWAVQSSGVDYLHMLLVAMRYLCRLHSIPARLCLTIHDELRYLVPERQDHPIRLAACLQVANLWTRAMFMHRLGMRELPLGVAFFSAVDVDRVLRKEPTISCVTPSNPVPIPPGKSIDVYALPQDILYTPDTAFESDFRKKLLSSSSPRLEPVILPSDPEYLRRQAGLKSEQQSTSSNQPRNGSVKQAKKTTPTVTQPHHHVESEEAMLTNWRGGIGTNAK